MENPVIYEDMDHVTYLTTRINELNIQYKLLDDSRDEHIFEMYGCDERAYAIERGYVDIPDGDIIVEECDRRIAAAKNKLALIVKEMECIANEINNLRYHLELSCTLNQG